MPLDRDPGAIRPSDDFLLSASAADLLESAKSDLRGNRQGIRRYERMLDRAWEAVDAVCRGLGDRQGRALADRHLLGMTWAEVGSDCGTSQKTARNDVADALAWLDASYDDEIDRRSRKIVR